MAVHPRFLIAPSANVTGCCWRGDTFGPSCMVDLPFLHYHVGIWKGPSNTALLLPRDSSALSILRAD